MIGVRPTKAEAWVHTPYPDACHGHAQQQQLPIVQPDCPLHLHQAADEGGGAARLKAVLRAAKVARAWGRVRGLCVSCGVVEVVSRVGGMTDLLGGRRGRTAMAVASGRGFQTCGSNEEHRRAVWTARLGGPRRPRATVASLVGCLLWQQEQEEHC